MTTQIVNVPVPVPPNRPFNINQRTLVDSGMMISPNLMLNHLSSGAFHPGLGRIIPTFPTVIDPNILRNVPLWKLARNLAYAGNMIEPLMKEFGSSLVIQAGFSLGAGLMNNLTRETGHMAGLSFDLSIDGFADDMSYVAKDITRLAGFGASSINLINGAASSWMHFNVDPVRVLGRVSNEIIFRTVDVAEGVVTNGLSEGLSSLFPSSQNYTISQNDPVIQDELAAQRQAAFDMPVD